MRAGTVVVSAGLHVPQQLGGGVPALSFEVIRARLRLCNRAESGARYGPAQVPDLL